MYNDSLRPFSSSLSQFNIWLSYFSKNTSIVFIPSHFLIFLFEVTTQCVLSENVFLSLSRQADKISQSMNFTNLATEKGLNISLKKKRKKIAKYKHYSLNKVNFALGLVIKSTCLQSHLFQENRDDSFSDSEDIITVSPSLLTTAIGTFTYQGVSVFPFHKLFCQVLDRSGKPIFSNWFFSNSLGEGKLWLQTHFNPLKN